MYARTRSPLRKLSRGISSSRRSNASARPSSTIRLPYSVRFTTPLTISPTRSLNSSYCFLRSYSRTRCTITCLAVCAAMRPKSIGGSGSTRCSPSLISGLNFLAIWTGIWVSSFSTVSTASVQRERRTSPVLRSMVARMSFSCPYLARPAFWMACSMASNTSSRSMFFSRATASATRSNSGRAMAVSILASVLVGPSWGGGGGDQCISQYQFGTADRVERQHNFVAVVEPEPRARLVGAQRDAREAPAAFDRRYRLGPREVSGEAVPVLGAGQGSIDAGGTDFQGPGAGGRILDVQHCAEGVADRLAVSDSDLAAVGPVGHYLDGGPIAAEHDDAHELITHAFQRGADDCGQPRFEAGMLRFRCVQKQKRRPVKATL